MIDPTNVNPNDLNAAANSQVDPNFLPKDSNVYIRTMNTDLSNLKSQGGEALPYVEAPVAIPNLNTVPTPVPPPAPMPTPMPVPPPPPMPTPMPVPPMPTPVPPPIPSPVNLMAAMMPEIKNDLPPVNTPMPEPIMPPVNVPTATPVVEMQPSTLDNLQQKINELNPSLNPTPLNNMPVNNAGVDNLSANLNADLNNLAPLEDVGQISSINPEEEPPKKKGKLILIAAILGVVILAVIIIFVIRPKMMRPTVTFTPPDDENSLTPPTTVLPATLTPFIPLKNPFQVSNLSIDISKLSQIAEQIKLEGNSLMAPGTFKVIVPKIKTEYLTSAEIVNLLLENPPQSLITNLEEKYLLYTFYGEVHPSLGVVLQAKSTSIEAIRTELLAWETNRNIVKNTSKLWLFTPKASKTKVFKESEVLSAQVRSFEYPEKEATLAYAFWNNYIIITTSLESMNSALTHIQNGDTPVVK